MNMLSYILLGLLLICSLTVFGVFGAPSEMPVWYTCSVIILVATIGIFVYLYIKSQKQKKAVQALRGYVYYDKEKQILTVEKRLPEFERASDMLEGRVKCGRVDTTSEKGLRIKFAAATLPMLALYQEGRFVDLVDGVASAEKIVDRVERVLAGDFDPKLARKILQ